MRARVHHYGWVCVMPLFVLAVLTIFGGRVQGKLPAVGVGQPERHIRFKTDEGTRLSLDVSPDGKEIVFGLLGDLYVMPITGGEATRLTSGIAWDCQPRFSPDGKSIVFVSDRSGSLNLWLMDSDGRNIRPLTENREYMFMSPTWTPDGQHIVVTRSTGSTFEELSSMGQLLLYSYPVVGGAPEALTQVTKWDGAEYMYHPMYVGASFAADPSWGTQRGIVAFDPPKSGRWLWEPGTFELDTFDLATHVVRPFLSLPGGAIRPLLSPHGRYLVYGTRRNRGKETWLRVRDLTSGKDQSLIGPVDEWLGQTQPDEENVSLGFSEDLLPGSAFLPDESALITAYQGHFWRVSIPDGAATQISFIAEVDQTLAPLAHFEHPYNDSTLVARRLQDFRLAPDKKHAAFVVLDRLYEMEWPAGVPHRVTSDDVEEFSPDWSSDSHTLAYATWSDVAGGAVRRLDVGRVQRWPTITEPMTHDGAAYHRIAFAPDGGYLVAARAERDVVSGPLEKVMDAHGITYVAISATHRAIAVTPVAKFDSFFGSGWPSFNAGPTNPTNRIYYSTAPLHDGEWSGSELRSALLNGHDDRLELGLPKRTYTSNIDGGGDVDVQRSPDGQHLLISTGHFSLILVDLPPAPMPTDYLLHAPSTAIHVISNVGGIGPRWLPDGQSFTYTIGRTAFVHDMNAAADARADGRTYVPEQHELDVTLAKDKPNGTIVLRGARIITMRGDEVIPDGDIVITDNRIAAVGPVKGISVPDGATVLDVRGKTIVPGWVDIHSHLTPYPLFDPVPRGQEPRLLIELAFGVTTAHDPNASDTVTTLMDRLETGDLLGPRIFSTGPSNADPGIIQSPSDGVAFAQHIGEVDGLETIKSHQGALLVRERDQWFIEGARTFHLNPTFHQSRGGLREGITHVLDGANGLEHPLFTYPLYRDALQLLAQSGVTYTPTLVASLDGGQIYGPTIDDRSRDKVNRFEVAGVLAFRVGERPPYAPELIPEFASQLAKLSAAGGRVGFGSHNHVPGVGAHWELEAMASGMPVHEVLRSATLVSAEAIGHGADFGSLEPGKLADLQILGKNPLDDIRNVSTIEYVMKGGRLYDAATLSEMWPRKRPLNTNYWWLDPSTKARLGLSNKN